MEVFVRNFGLKSAIANVTVYFICAGVEGGRATKDFDLTNQREMKAAVTPPGGGISGSESSLHKLSIDRRNPTGNELVRDRKVGGKNIRR